MSPPPLPPGPPVSGLDITAVLPYFVALVTAALGFFGARYTATAPLQESLNSAFRTLTAELQAERAQHVARICELEATVRNTESEILRLRGELRASQQREGSLKRWADRSGLKLPLD